MAKKKQLPPVVVATDKKKALDQALAQIEKQHGANAVMYLGQEPRLLRSRQRPFQPTAIRASAGGLDAGIEIAVRPDFQR